MIDMTQPTRNGLRATATVAATGQAVAYGVTCNDLYGVLIGDQPVFVPYGSMLRDQDWSPQRAYGPMDVLSIRITDDVTPDDVVRLRHRGWTVDTAEYVW